MNSSPRKINGGLRCRSRTSKNEDALSFWLKHFPSPTPSPPRTDHGPHTPCWGPLFYSNHCKVSKTSDLCMTHKSVCEADPLTGTQMRLLLNYIISFHENHLKSRNSASVKPQASDCVRSEHRHTQLHLPWRDYTLGKRGGKRTVIQRVNEIWQVLNTLAWFFNPHSQRWSITDRHGHLTRNCAPSPLHRRLPWVDVWRVVIWEDNWPQTDSPWAGLVWSLTQVWDLFL